MTNTTFRILPKAIAAFAITATFSSATFAGEFTVRAGKRYRATLGLDSVEQLADNALIAGKFRALGFTKVRVSGAEAIRRVEGVWPRKDASALLPRQIVAVAKLSEFLIIAIVAVSTLVGVLIYLLLGTIRAGLSSVESEERLLAEAENNHLKAR